MWRVFTTLRGRFWGSKHPSTPGCWLCLIASQCHFPPCLGELPPTSSGVFNNFVKYREALGITGSQKFWCQSRTNSLLGQPVPLSDPLSLYLWLPTLHRCQRCTEMQKVCKQQYRQQSQGWYSLSGYYIAGLSSEHGSHVKS